MESTRKIVKDSVFFFFGQRRKSTPVVNGLTWHGRVGDAWGRVGDAWRVGRAWDAWERGAREARGIVARGARESAWERVGARGNAWSAWGRVAGPLAARGGAWARVWRAKNFWRRVGARTRSDPADFGLNGQIVMRSIQ